MNFWASNNRLKIYKAQPVRQIKGGNKLTDRKTWGKLKKSILIVK